MKLVQRLQKVILKDQFSKPILTQIINYFLANGLYQDKLQESPEIIGIQYYMGLTSTKPVFKVSNTVRFKPA